jgi:hypothetical protein
MKAPLTRFRTRLLSTKSVEKWMRDERSNLAHQKCFLLTTFRSVISFANSCEVFAFNLTNIVVQIGFRASSTAKIAFFRITQSHVEINCSGHC